MADKVKLTRAQKEIKAHSVLETFKTIVIVALVAGAVAFMSGIHYQQHVDEGKSSAVNTAIKNTAATLKN